MIIGLAAVLRALARAHWRAACGERSVGCRVGAASLGEFREVDAKFGKCWRPPNSTFVASCRSSRRGGMYALLSSVRTAQAAVDGAYERSPEEAEVEASRSTH